MDQMRCSHPVTLSTEGISKVKLFQGELIELGDLVLQEETVGETVSILPVSQLGGISC